MMYLVSQILFYILAAAVLGLFVGWLLTRNAADRRELSLRSDWESHMSGVRSLQSEMAAKIRSSEERLSQQDAQIEAMRIRISDTDRVNARKTEEARALASAHQTQSQELERYMEALTKAAEINKRLESELEAAKQAAAAPGSSDQVDLMAEVGRLEAVISEKESDLAQLSAFNEELEARLEHNQPEAPSPAEGEREDVSVLRDIVLERDAQIEALTRDLNSHEQQAASAELKLEQFEILKRKFVEIEKKLADAQKGHPADDDSPASENESHSLPRLYAAKPEKVDNLRSISGIGKKLERTLHDLGIYQFTQLAELSAHGEQWLDDQLGSVKGRVSRDQWVEQARELLNAKNDQ